MLFEIDWIVSDDTVVRPDVVVICGETPEKHIESPPALVAEIQSASSIVRDREAKRDLYREQGVAIYLLIDPEERTLEVFRKDSDQDWVHEFMADTIELSICRDCRLSLTKDSLFR